MLVASVRAMPCTALAMSGGANRGAWEAGVLWGLAHYGNPEDYHYDVISGVSAGSINTAGLAGWAPEDIVEMTEYMSDVWLGLTNSDVWNERPDPYVQIPLGEPSLLDDSAALATIRDVMSLKSDFAKRVTVASVDLQTGEYHEFN